MKKNNAIKILEHPDKDEIIAKLACNTSPNDINEWLTAKYSEPHEKNFVLSKNLLATFKDEYLDFYNYMYEDLKGIKQAKALVASDPIKDLELHVKGNSAYKNALTKLAGKQLDIKTIITNMVVAIEERAGQCFDLIAQDPNNITKYDRILIEWMELLGASLEKYHKIIEQGDQNVNITNNVNIQVIDDQISIFYEAFKECLGHMDLETSMRCMEIFNTKITALKMKDKSKIDLDKEFTDVQILNDTIVKRLQ